MCQHIIISKYKMNEVSIDLNSFLICGIDTNNYLHFKVQWVVSIVQVLVICLKRGQGLFIHRLF